MSNKHPNPRAQQVLDTGRIIWKDVFEITIQHKYTVELAPDSDLRDLSVAQRTLMEASMEKHVTTYVTIDDMVEYFREGIPFQLSKNYLYAVYDLIVGYIDAYLDYLDGQHNSEAPIDDLLLMDELAAAVFTQAVNYVGARQEAVSSLFRQTKGLGVASIGRTVEAMDLPSHPSRKVALRRYLAKNSNRTRRT